jgi:hypothetical protein
MPRIKWETDVEALSGTDSFGMAGFPVGIKKRSLINLRLLTTENTESTEIKCYKLE